MPYSNPTESDDVLASAQLHHPPVTVKDLAQIMGKLIAANPYLTEGCCNRDTKTKTETAPSENNTAVTNQHIEQHYWGGEFFNAYGIGTTWQVQISADSSHIYQDLDAPTSPVEESTPDLSKNRAAGVKEQALEHPDQADFSPAIHTANRVWQSLQQHSVCVNREGEAVGLPHGIQLPLAFGSFAFDATRGGWLKIPAISLILADNRLFLYRSSRKKERLTTAPVMPTGIGETDVNLAQGYSFGSVLGTAQHDETKTAQETEEAHNSNTPDKMGVKTLSLTAAEWQAAVQQAIEIIRNSEIEKIVLAREDIVASGINADPISVLATLETEYQSCWRYWLGDLIGASPEMLTQIIDGQLLCRVLAGTCVRGEEAALIASAKEQIEHAYAVKSAYRSLKPLLREIEKPSNPFLLRLPTLSHLATDLSVKNPRISSLEAVAVLHPTAAVCGTPKAKVEQLIPELEKIDRGHYAGPIGWIDSQGQGEWAIALRCAQIVDANQSTLDGNSQHDSGVNGTGYQYRLLAGAGIVADSIPEKEYEETNTKMYPLRNAIAHVNI